jgi:hypothetical protein
MGGAAAAIAGARAAADVTRVGLGVETSGLGLGEAPTWRVDPSALPFVVVFLT